MFARKLISRNACLPRTVCSFVCDFHRLRNHGIRTNFLRRQFHVFDACTGDACTLETRRRFMTERQRKKEGKAEISTQASLPG